MRQVKSIAGELAGIGCLVKRDEYIDVILHGLLQEYTLKLRLFFFTHESCSNRF